MSKLMMSLIVAITIVVIAAAVAVLYLPSAAMAKYDRQLAVTPASIPIPWPDESGDPDIALAKAIERGERYVTSRVGCADCHGENMAGGIIVDNPVMGRWVAPNITRAGVIADYEPRDWVGILRHGMTKAGRPASMPSRDFTNLSDQEISDIAAYISSLPPVEDDIPPTKLGPMMSMLILAGEIPIDADHIDHTAERRKLPPEIAPTLELGEHLANVCVGCHGQNLSGGAVPGGDPSWPPASNLTFHASGLEGWTLEQFTTVMRTGERPDGRILDPAMPIRMTKNFEDDEIKALYMHLETLPPTPQGEREATPGA